MLERIPHLVLFLQTYWNQMGPEVHGTIEGAFRQFVADLSRSRDGGASVRRELFGELMLILDSEAYQQWLDASRTDIPTLNALGGCFILPNKVRPLLAILDERLDPDA
jgi:hypothetical protein